MKRRRERHAFCGTRSYRIWCNIKTRCTNPKTSGYSKYGAKGITVCGAWASSFSTFLADMGACPSPQHSIDRIDNQRGYEPGNCRWATIAEQARNRSDNTHVEYQGARMCIVDAARLAGIHHATVNNRRARGWPEGEWFAPTTNKHARARRMNASSPGTP